MPFLSSCSHPSVNGTRVVNLHISPGVSFHQSLDVDLKRRILRISFEYSGGTFYVAISKNDIEKKNTKDFYQELMKQDKNSFATTTQKISP